jgi:sarcosine oxidase subunit delta
MLLIDCPYCGPRNENEFRYGGESHVARPGLAPEVGDAAWADYMFNRTNAKGPHRERWCHVHGCGQWFNIVRDTATHAVLAVYRMGEPPPEGWE